MSTNVVPFLFNESMIRTTIDADGTFSSVRELVEESESKMSLLSTSTGASRETPFEMERQ